MSLTKISIKEPVFITMIILAINVIGFYASANLQIALAPVINSPFVLVTTELDGASPEVINEEITKKIEDAVNVIPGIKHIHSTSKQDISTVFVEFEIDTDPLVDEEKVRNFVEAIIDELPQDTKKPVVRQIDFNDIPVMNLVVSGKGTAKDITEIAKNLIQRQLESVEGVGRVDLIGGSERQIRVLCDPVKLDAYSLTLNDVMQAVQTGSVEVPAGTLDQGFNEAAVTTKAKISDVKDFEKLVVKAFGSSVVYLSDLAQIIDGTKKPVSISRVNLRNAIGLNIIQQSQANTVEVARQAKRKIAQLQKQLGEDIQISVIIDTSDFIKSEDDAVIHDIVTGILLTVLVVFFFLNSLRATAISTFSLTTSIISSFALMYVLGYTINYMTLLALTLSVGLLIDDAIVIIENIYRKLGKGEKKNRKKAVEKASDEISLAVTATTLTIVAVFLPVAFMPGIIGQYFLQFGITVSFAVLVSLFVAFTYTPMMASRWLKPQPKSLKESRMLNRLAWKFNHGFKFFTKGYLRVLEWALFHKKIMMLLAGGIMALTLYFFKQLGSEFAPITDVGQFIMRVSLDPGASLEETSATVWKIEQDIARNPQVKKIFTSVGGGDHPVTHAEITVIMVDKSEREKSIREIENEYRQKFKDLPGVQLSFLGGIGSNDEQKPIEYHIKGENIDTLERIANEFILRLKQIDGIVDLHKDVQNSQPEYRVFVDRDKASIFGLSPFGVGSAIRTALSGTVAAEFDVKDERIDVLVQVDPALAQNMDELLRVKTRAGVPDKSGNFPLIPLSELTKVEKAFTLSQINRYDHQNSIEVSANLYGLLSGDALALIKEQIPLLNLPQGYEITVGGQTESQEQSMVAFVAVMLFSILFVYMILASLFRSYSQPFIIMFSLPLALLGACLGLIIAGSSLSIMAMIGLVMLLGLVTKNAILLVNYANQMQRKENKSCLEALLLAGKVRLKPIMMTSLAMIFGMIPIAFSVSEGSSFRAPMGQAVMGGLISSTIFTLLFIPVLYMMLDNFLNRKKQKADRQ